MRTLSPSLLTELGLTLTRPGYLVYIGLSTPLRLSTLGDISWGGYTWAGADVKVANLSRNERAGQGGSISLGNAWTDYGALLLNEAIADCPIRIYAVWAGVVEPVQEFEGVGDACEIGQRCTITLAASKSRSAFSPRRFINAAAGFNTLLPKGAKVRIGTQTLILDR